MIPQFTGRSANLSTAYIDAVAWIQQQIESDDKYRSDDTRFWVDVVPI